MTPHPPIDLSKLPHLSEMFAALNSGRHLNRLTDVKLWTELEREREAFELLFAKLGYALRIDERGFAWFQVEEATSSVSRTTRQLALLFLLVFEVQADAGRHLGRFTDWRIDIGFLNELIEKHRPVLEAEGLADRDQLSTLLRAAVNYGFAEADGNAWRLLLPVCRYLDRFEQLTRVEVSDEPGSMAEEADE